MTDECPSRSYVAPKQVHYYLTLLTEKRGNLMKAPTKLIVSNI